MRKKQPLLPPTEEELAEQRRQIEALFLPDSDPVMTREEIIVAVFGSIDEFNKYRQLPALYQNADVLIDRLQVELQAGQISREYIQNFRQSVRKP
ncbi:hypothetical protein [Tellurirhabdus bombi]|uniref:hypothetical protein n=1 Tax=Tellurirhabdus bombi TaxID=2907205 RepID=UPI001F21B4DE|nr:hypothetical protein [Tellurirhabdus bombi]